MIVPATPVSPRHLRRALAVTATLSFSAAVTFGQVARIPAPGAPLLAAAAELPDSPTPNIPASAESSSSATPDSAPQDSAPQDGVAKSAETSRPLPNTLPHTASIYETTIYAGQVGPPQTRREQVVSGLRDSISPFTFAGEVISAGYSHVTNGSPNYGTNAPAFGSRAGASFARGSSQNIFSESVLAPILREDSRYYQLGPSVPFFERLIYAGTRPLVTRTMSGHHTVNISQLGGYLGAAYLTRTYNPVLNQSNDEVLKIYGTSIGGAAIGYVVTEFLPDTLSFLHLSHVKFLHQ